MQKNIIKNNKNLKWIKIIDNKYYYINIFLLLF